MLDVLGKPASLKAHVDERPGQVDRHIGSTEKAERLLGWRARTSFEEGLARTVEWYRENEAGGGESGSGTQASSRPRGGAGQLGLLEAARDARASTSIAVDRDPAAPGFRFADRRAIISVEDEPQIDRLAAAERVDGVIAPGHRLAGRDRRADRRAARPAAPDRPGRRAVLATSKLRQRERFAEAGVPHPRHVVCATLEEAAAAAAGFGYPCVVKAPDRQGQKGLVLVRGRAAARGGVRARARRVARRTSCSSRSSSPGAR